MSAAMLNQALAESQATPYLQQTAETTLARTLAMPGSEAAAYSRPKRLPRLGFIYETQGLAAYQRWASRREDTQRQQARLEFSQAFTCWQALLKLDLGHGMLNGHGSGQLLVSSELRDEPLPPWLTLSFHASVAGLVAERTAEVRLDLASIQFAQVDKAASWRDRVLGDVFAAFVLLCRKGGGWADIQDALQRVASLRQLQADYEAEYLSTQGDEGGQAIAAAELLGLYHAAQMVTLVGTYLENGTPSAADLLSRFDRHQSRARMAFAATDRPLLVHLVDLLWVGCRELVSNAIWTHVTGLGENTREFVRHLASQGRPDPVLELWPSQQAALRGQLLNVYPRAIIVQMPTSAGKTLLAKFLILQTKALNSTGTIAYIVPTRALVNQVTLDLRSDFHDLGAGFQVEQAVPAFELDPTEDALLINPPDILVTTPEKLDLLVRRNHLATSQLVLVIADEAHNLQSGRGRGSRLEFLLGTLKRERATIRFLLLSPFLPNDRDLVTWLSDGIELAPIKVDWRPSRRIVGTVSSEGRQPNRTLVLKTVASAHNSDLRAGLSLPIGPIAGGGDSIKGLTKATVTNLEGRGATLVLCKGPGTATKRALELAESRPVLPSSPLRDAVLRYLQAEVGRESALTSCLERGVVFHHAGISQETRWLIERLIKLNDVRVVCGTTTLAQGVNFPISNVIVETLDKGDRRKGDSTLTYQDFWNIAGRAGRTLVDTVGVVVFPTPEDHQRDAVERFMKHDAEEVLSQIIQLLRSIGSAAIRLDMHAVGKWPELAALLQYLAHAARVAGQTGFSTDIEDLLRSSLVYHQLAKQHDGDILAQRLFDLCTAYLRQLGALTGQAGVLALADDTGFTTPSVQHLLRQKQIDPRLRDVHTWEPATLFGSDLTHLTSRIAALGELPEVRLGTGSDAPFSPRRVAAILRDWVAGVPLATLAERHGSKTEKDVEQRLSRFNGYLFGSLLGLATWGLGALEGVCLSGESDEVWQRVGHVPSMIFFGVRQREAVLMRMAGVPRLVAEGLGRHWAQQGRQAPSSYDEIRQWVSSLPADVWTRALPRSSKLRANDLQLLWKEFSG